MTALQVNARRAPGDDDSNLIAGTSAELGGGGVLKPRLVPSSLSSITRERSGCTLKDNAKHWGGGRAAFDEWIAKHRKNITFADRPDATGCRTEPYRPG